jgi:septum formation protein
VLAADTVVAIGRRVLPKADCPDAVERCLRALSGRRHRVWTAVVLSTPGPLRSERLVGSTVTFDRLTDHQIAAYVATNEGEGKAGGYAIQGRAASFVRFFSGSYTGVVGLPLFETAQLLRGAGWLRP